MSHDILSLEVFYSTFFDKEGKENLQYSILSNHNTSRMAMNENHNTNPISTHVSGQNRIGTKAFSPSPHRKYILFHKKRERQQMEALRNLENG